MMKETVLAAHSPMEEFRLPQAVSSAAAHPAGRLARKKAEEREYNFTWSVFFTIFLFVATLTRPLPRRWRPLGSSSGERKSIIGEARSAAHMITPFVFMR